MFSNLKNSRGGSSIEGLIWLPLLAGGIWAGASLLKAQYFRLRCSVLTFETTRKALEGTPTFPQEIKIFDHGSCISGSGRCEKAVESITLRKLLNQNGSVLIPGLLITLAF